MSSLSILITAFEQHPVTVKHIEMCMDSTRCPDEIVVVNDHGTPDLKDLILALPNRKCPIRYAYVIENIPWNYTGARNLAFWISRGDYVSTEDNEQIPFPDFYEKAIGILENNKNIGVVRGGERPVICKDDLLNKPKEQWQILNKRPFHKDTMLMRREVWIELKGYDERFAGAYAWASTDWRRRQIRAEIESANISNFYAVADGDVGSLEKRKSYRNYSYARESDGHTQGPIGVLNFHYTFETL